MKKLMSYLIVGIFCSVITLGAYKMLGLGKPDIVIEEVAAPSYSQLISEKKYGKNGGLPVDFTWAAQVSTPAVVHIKSVFMTRDNLEEGMDPLREFFDDNFHRRGPQGLFKAEAAGSGVIISDDGYVITNNHVIENADQVEVTLFNKRSYKAKIVGTDPSTDLAILKIEDKKLPHLVIGNSDSVKVGEWVVAVGNPFNLASTVTAGIVSAKGRNLHILRENYAIESFIQTDAAVNPGNSGGALVNLKGELVGINTAIATPTGTYAGYAFAIPTTIVKKIIADILKYGVVQRGFLGVIVRELNDSLINALKLKAYDGVFVEALMPDGAASKAGIKRGDIILKIDSAKVNNSGQLQEAIGQKRPGEKVTVTVLREGKEKQVEVMLQNSEGTSKIIEKKEESAVLKRLGIQLQDISSLEKKKLKIKGGVRVAKLRPGKVTMQTDMQEGFIILKMNGKEVSTAKQLTSMLSDAKGGIMLEGIYPGLSGVIYYAFGI